jgi:putative two-component system response regulator
MRAELTAQTTRPLVVVADDQPETLLILTDTLEADFDVQTFSDGSSVLDYVMQGKHADLFLLDVLMPGLDGFELCRRLKAYEKTRDVPVVIITSLDGAVDEMLGLEVGAIDFLHKPISPAVTLARVRNHLALAGALRLQRQRNTDLEQLVAERTAAIREQSETLRKAQDQIIVAQSATITAFCALAEARDNETGNHIKRTQNFVRCLAEELRKHPRHEDLLSSEYISLLYQSAPLHDIGKVAIPDHILLKPGPLTAEEWVTMRKHTTYGAEAIAAAEAHLEGHGESFLRIAREISLYHHEKWDGSGYPHALEGEAIPLSARLMAVADVYDALTTRRVYKPPFPHEQAVSMITEGCGKHFDPLVIDVFLTIQDDFQAIAQQFADH